MKYQSVLFACMKLHNIKDSPPLPQESWSGSFFFFPIQPVFHLSVAQKAKASNDGRYKMERSLPTRWGKKPQNKHIFA